MDQAQLKIAKGQLSKLNAYKNIFNSPLGKDVLHDLMERFWMNKPLAGAGNVDLHTVLHRDGERNVVLYILSQMKVNSSTLEKAIDEIENKNT